MIFFDLYMSISLLLDNVPKPWCNIFVNNIVGNDIVAKTLVIDTINVTDLGADYINAGVMDLATGNISNGFMNNLTVNNIFTCKTIFTLYGTGVATGTNLSLSNINFTYSIMSSQNAASVFITTEPVHATGAPSFISFPIPIAAMGNFPNSNRCIGTMCSDGYATYHVSAVPGTKNIGCTFNTDSTDRILDVTAQIGGMTLS